MNNLVINYCWENEKIRALAFIIHPFENNFLPNFIFLKHFPKFAVLK